MLNAHVAPAFNMAFVGRINTAYGGKRWQSATLRVLIPFSIHFDYKLHFVDGARTIRNCLRGV